MKASQAHQTNQQPLYGWSFALIAVAGFLLTVMLHREAVAQTKSSQGIRNIVIVHGAWADDRVGPK